MRNDPTGSYFLYENAIPLLKAAINELTLVIKDPAALDFLRMRADFYLNYVATPIVYGNDNTPVSSHDDSLYPNVHLRKKRLLLKYRPHIITAETVILHARNWLILSIIRPKQIFITDSHIKTFRTESENHPTGIKLYSLSSKNFLQLILSIDLIFPRLRFHLSPAMKSSDCKELIINALKNDLKTYRLSQLFFKNNFGIKNKKIEINGIDDFAVAAPFIATLSRKSQITWGQITQHGAFGNLHPRYDYFRLNNVPIIFKNKFWSDEYYEEESTDPTMKSYVAKDFDLKNHSILWPFEFLISNYEKNFINSLSKENDLIIKLRPEQDEKIAKKNYPNSRVIRELDNERFDIIIGFHSTFFFNHYHLAKEAFYIIGENSLRLKHYPSDIKLVAISHTALKPA